MCVILIKIELAHILRFKSKEQQCPHVTTGFHSLPGNLYSLYVLACSAADYFKVGYDLIINAMNVVAKERTPNIPETAQPPWSQPLCHGCVYIVIIEFSGIN